MGVTLVTQKQPFCRNCDIGKRLLQSADIPFETVDITEYDGDTAGIRQLPILVIDGNAIGSLNEIRKYAKNIL